MFRMTLNVSLTTGTDPSRSLRMTPNGNHMLRLFNSQLTADNFYLLTVSPRHGNRSFTGALNDALPYPVIQSGSKNAV